MSEHTQGWIARHPLLSFFGLAYAISWAVELPIALSARGLVAAEVHPGIHFFAGLGPLLAAFIVTAVTAGRAGVGELWARVVKWRVGTGWLLFGLLSVPALYLASAIAVRLGSGTWPDLGRFGTVFEFPALGAAVGMLLHLFGFGFGEEVGWRGFALPRLQRRHSALAATFILSIFWALWHLPMFFYKENFMAMGVGGTIMFFLSMFAGAILLTWLYNSTRGSVLMVALWHGLLNAATARAEPNVQTIFYTVVFIGVALILIIAKPADLSRAGKQVL
ncbi:CPBP family glutamic-type intramembrane protease [Haliangium sp.]|uniref:CPBP family glutamic-type intramembrane protease n=1 Tax=Haliangium sp. TaxID=2663208 RepID=UPI003D0CA3C0